MKKLIAFCLLCLLFMSCKTPWSPRDTTEFYETEKYYNIDLKLFQLMVIVH